MNIFSPNMLKTFDECPKKFFFKYVQKIAIPQRYEIFEKGKKIHALANYFLSGENIAKMEAVLNPEEKIVWKCLKSNKYFKMDILNTEYNLTCKIENYWLGGRLDAFVKEKSLSDYFILDYKTGNIPQNPKYDFQTIIYLLCTDKLLKKQGNYNSLKFVYLGLKDNSEKEIKLTQDLKQQYETKIIEICNKIDFAVNSNVFVCDKKSCKFCEYSKLCNNRD